MLRTAWLIYFATFGKAIGINLVDRRERHNDYGLQCKVLPFLLTSGVKKKNARTGRLTESPFWIINLQLTAFGERR